LLLYTTPKKATRLSAQLSIKTATGAFFILSSVSAEPIAIALVTASPYVISVFSSVKAVFVGCFLAEDSRYSKIFFIKKFSEKVFWKAQKMRDLSRLAGKVTENLYYMALYSPKIGVYH
jgi:hypothetical protein